VTGYSADNEEEVPAFDGLDRVEGKDAGGNNAAFGLPDGVSGALVVGNS
jgi:hypothetical protein